MRRIVTLMTVCILMAGCKGLVRTVEVPVEVHDTMYRNVVQHDSTYIDRWHTIETKGDTVYVTTEQITVKWRTTTDTAYKYVEKPVTVTVEQIKEVEKPLSWWQKMQQGGFWLLLAVMFAEAVALFFAIKRKIKWR